MGQQFGRKVPRSTQPTPTTAKVSGQDVHIDGDAVRTWQNAAATPESGISDLRPDVDVKALRDTIGVDGIRRAAADAGRTPPSDRTIRRWVKNNRIPHSEVAERAQRRGWVTREGGINAAASKVGVSPSSISRYQQGQTSNFRQHRHQQAARNAQAADALTRAGIADSAGNLVKPFATVRVSAAFEYRNNGKTSGDYRASRAFDISLDAIDSKEFADAAAQGDSASQVAILERHLSVDYASSFDDYNDDTGFHMVHVERFSVEWE